MLHPGLRVGEPLANTRHVLRRGCRESDGLPVLVRIPSAGIDRSAAIAMLRREYDVLTRLDLDGVPRALEFDESTGALVLEDIGGAPLGALLVSRPLKLETFLQIALHVSTTIGALHRAGIVHGNLGPESILVHPTSNRVQLLDLGNASRCSLDEDARDLLQGELAYAAPERTGRMSLVVDHRSDIYSLGAVFYEMLSGRPPFVSDDPLEVVHGHIARTAPALATIEPSVHPQVSAIVTKLLSKDPGDRYQSAWGLAEDLESCARQWATSGTISPFPLGRADIPDRFTIPHHLYGRDGELRALLDSFEAARRGPASMVLIGGYSGIGKTSLVLKIQRPVVRSGGRFVTGKFDQLDRTTPYGALLQALRSLLLQALSESDERLGNVRERVRSALGVNGGVLSAVLPELELLIGPQSPPPPLRAEEGQNRFNYVLESFLDVFATSESPLVVFLDDLQWADSATLGLLQHLMTSPSLRFLLLIGAYRENEVVGSHPLLQTLRRIRDADAETAEIVLQPLRSADLQRLVADAFHCESDRVAHLSRLVHDKTGGNPFFVGQFLQTLHSDGLLEFDHHGRRWTFDLDRIESADITDNVVDLMTRKLQRLSPSARQAITLAACIGAEFTLATLAVIREKPQRAVAAELGEALKEGLILADLERFRFLHDRVQQAAYALIPPDRRRMVHLRVGRLLLARFGTAIPEEALFEIVNHLDLGAALVTDEDERRLLVRLNMQTGRKAKASAAFRAALGYFEQGLELLPPDAWSADYETTLALSTEVAECHYLCGNFDAAERGFEELVREARSPVEKSEAYRMRLVQNESQARYEDAVRAGRDALLLFGVRFPEDRAAQLAALEEELHRIEALLGDREISSLVELPVLTDLETKTVIAMLTAMWAPAYIMGHDLLAFLFSAHIVRLSLERGNTEDSAYGYVTHAIAVGPVRGDHHSAYEWGSLALRVNERFGDRKLRAKVHQQFNAHVTLWRRPLATCILHAREACRSGLESGDFNYAGYGAFTESWAALLVGRDLEDFVQEFSPTVNLLERIRMKSLADAQELFLGWAMALRGRTGGRLSLSHERFDEVAYEAAYASNPFCLTFLLMAKLHLGLLFEEFDAAVVVSRRIREEAWIPAGTIWPVLLDFWGGLALAACHERLPEHERDPALGTLRAARDAMRDLAESCPENFRCFHLMLAAEVERLERAFGASLQLFEEAIAYARRTENLQQEALGNELCARLWVSRGRDGVAAVYLREAHRCYSAWGAQAKVRQLEERHARLLAVDAPRAHPPGQARSLDLATVLKAAHAVVAEIELDKLLQTLVRIAIENAGAERGFMLQEREGRLLIVAEADAPDGRVRLSSTPIEARTDLSRAIVLLVHRTGESVIVDDAMQDSRWVDDDYAAGVRPRSILCTPIVHQGRRAGLFYLDNSKAPHAFAPARIELVQVLSAQAAIALENARLYAGLRDEVERRASAEQALKQALDEVRGLKDRLHRENLYLQEEIRTQHNFTEIVGSSPALLEALRKVEQVARTESSVLILGETGSGKELFARALHGRSGRSDRPLVKVSCGAIPAGLVESELFGHVKGAFTGALQNRTGRFELADGGAIFLDEVGELPLDTQVKLLRVLQEREFEPVGSNRTVRVDVRVIAATNRDLDEMVREGRFRSDLLYRLNVFPIRVPPLRERTSDIPLIVSFFLTGLSKKLGKTLTGFSRRSMERLVRYPWPGNVRELENIVQRAAIVATGPVLELDADPLGGAPSPAAETPGRTLAEVEREHVLEALRGTHGVVEGPRGAARLLGLHPNTLRSRIKRLGLTRADYEIS